VTEVESTTVTEVSYPAGSGGGDGRGKETGVTDLHSSGRSVEVE